MNLNFSRFPEKTHQYHKQRIGWMLMSLMLIFQMSVNGVGFAQELTPSDTPVEATATIISMEPLLSETETAAPPISTKSSPVPSEAPTINRPTALPNSSPTSFPTLSQNMASTSQPPNHPSDLQSTTGPVPPVGIFPIKGGDPLLGTSVTLTVPEYYWHHGCGPTSVGMVVGYWDNTGFPDLVSGVASSQTDEVNNMMASTEHYNDYSLPMDESTSTILADKSESGGAHSDNSVGDWMHTSWSVDNNRYGWSYASKIGPSFTNYISYISDGTYSASFQNFNIWDNGIDNMWNTLISEIDAGKPVVFLVDTNGDGWTDHFVPAIGYNDDTHQYAFHSTWDSDGWRGILWADFVSMQNGSNWGVAWITSFDVVSVEKTALTALYNSTEGNNWFNKNGWLTEDNVCNWYSVYCTDGHITRLDLSNNNLNGSIPPELGNLTKLMNLSLQNNQLNSSIPPELGNLTKLTSLDLSANQLSGSIPNELVSLVDLTTLDLRTNFLSDVIPLELGNLTNLTSLYLGGNQLSGSIPTQIGSLPNLTILGLGGNQLSGSIPTQIGSLTNLQYLDLQNNQLNSSIPTELGNLPSLTGLGLDGNQLSGSIPTQLGSLSNLQSLVLQRNQLSGSIPTQLGNLPNLQYLDLQNNQLSGSIPTELGNLTNLIGLFLGLNQLNGSIPIELGSLTSLTVLNLQNNQLSSDIPSQLGNLINLTGLSLSNNQLSGEIPYSITNLTSIIDNNLDIGYNSLTSINDAVLTYLATKDPDWESTQSAPFTTCATVSGVLQPECEALVALYNSTNGSQWTNHSLWLETDNPCNWHGVSCWDGNIIDLSLRNNNLAGTISPEIGNLKVEGIDLSNNRLTGSIPTEIGNTANSSLKWFFLNGNQLSGNIPASIGRLTNLIFLNLSDNQLEGQVPAEITSLVNIPDNSLNLGFNRLISTYASVRTYLNAKDPDWESTQFKYSCFSISKIPRQECEALNQLYILTKGSQWTNKATNHWWETNDPCAWSGVTCSNGHVIGLALSGNRLYGRLPKSLWKLSYLEILNLEYNTLVGKIPNEWVELANLKVLKLGENGLMGKLPKEIWSIPSLEILDLHSNNLVGPLDIPTGIYRMRQVNLMDNRFIGSLPAGLGSMSNLEIFYFSNNNLCLPSYMNVWFNTISYKDTPFTLTFNTNPANGGSASIPSPNSCSVADRFSPNANIQVLANANTGLVFSGWTGAVTSSTNPLSLTMNTNKALTAKFNETCYTLTTTVLPAGSGSIIPSPLPNCTITGKTDKFRKDTVITLLAKPDVRAAFKVWSGAVSGSVATTTLSMTSDKTVTATFDLAPPAPRLLSPSGRVSETDNPLTYKWSAVASTTYSPAADQYELHVYRNSQDSPVPPIPVNSVDVCSDGTCSYQTAGVTLGIGTYQYRVRSHNLEAGWGSWSPWKVFNIAPPAPPSAPVLVSPTGSSLITTPVYTWNKVNGASLYYLLVYSYNSGGYVLTRNNLTCATDTCTLTQPSVLPAGNYGFKMRAYNASGWGNYSAWKNFRITQELPVVTLTSPTNNATDVAKRPTFTWNVVSGVSRYYLLVNNISNGSYPIRRYIDTKTCSDGTCSYTSTITLAGNIGYSYKVRAYRNNASWGAFSEPFSFTTIP